MRFVRRIMAVGWLVGVALAVPASAAGHAGGSSSPSGYDISYPQCGGDYPAHALFGIVGVNGGLANDANSCFPSELSWAQATPGQTSPAQPAVSLYINTADPGPGVADWPRTGTGGTYGSCDGTWSTACAYVYGQALAENSYGLVDPSVAAGAPWWLDIETANSWATSGTPSYTQLNIAAIQGFVAGLKGSGATNPVGIYSTASQWQAITGLTASTTASGFGSSPPNWIAGARSLTAAQRDCASTGFTGATPTLAQYPSGGFDADLRC